MSKLILYHGTSEKQFTPIFGLGNDRHDYGRGFYLTADFELAKEWAVCKPTEFNGWVHKYELDTDGLKILDFQEKNVLCWLAELMKNRDADDSRRYRVLSAKFIEKYGVDSSGYDVIKGWRANASYFYIAKEFVRDNIDIDILELHQRGIELAPQGVHAFVASYLPLQLFFQRNHLFLAALHLEAQRGLLILDDRECALSHLQLLLDLL